MIRNLSHGFYIEAAFPFGRELTMHVLGILLFTAVALTMRPPLTPLSINLMQSWPATFSDKQSVSISEFVG